MSVLIKKLAWIGLAFCLLSFSVGAAVEAEGKGDKGEATLNRSVEAQAYYDQIQAVLAQKKFGEKKKIKSWRLKNQDEKKKKQERPSWLSDLGFSDSFVLMASSIIEGLLWACVIAVIVYLLVRYRTQIKHFVSDIGRPSSAPDLPATMFGLDVKKTSMPKDVVDSAKLLWQVGEHRQAVALLLRASLIKLLHEHHCFFLDSDTEAECCERLDKHVPQPLSQYMHLLVQVWQQVAYAHRAPTDDMFNRLCQQWQEVF